MTTSSRSTPRARRAPSPIDAERLERLALHYVGRYATSRAKLAAYLRRKLRAAGWAGAGEPPVADVVGRLAALGYVDDRAFAAAKGAALARRGLGARRVALALDAAGIATEDRVADDGDAARASALRFAQRRRFGPFAAVTPDRAGIERALAAMLRAGHPLDLARRIVRASPGSEVDEL